MDLTALLLRATARRPHVLVVSAVGGTAERLAVEAALVRRGWPAATAPADADLLVVAGSPGPELAAVIERVWQQIPAPRARAEVRAPGEADRELDRAKVLLADPALQRASARRSEGPGAPVERVTDSQNVAGHEGHAGHDHGGEGYPDGAHGPGGHGSREPASRAGHELHAGSPGLGDHEHAGHGEHDVRSAHDPHELHAMPAGHEDHAGHRMHGGHEAHEDDSSAGGHAAHGAHANHEEQGVHGSHGVSGGHGGHGGYGGHAHGGHGGSMELPGGLPMADLGDDRDGLRLDRLHVTLGPVLPDWPSGLVVRAVMQGDVIQEASAEVLDAGTGRLFWKDVHPAARELDGLARFLGVAGWPDAAARARWLRDELLAGASVEQIGGPAAALVRRVRRSRTLRWSIRGLPAGETDVAALLEQRLAAIGAAVASGETSRVSRPALDELASLLVGAELAAARLIVAAVDPDTEEALAPEEVRHG